MGTTPQAEPQPVEVRFIRSPDAARFIGVHVRILRRPVDAGRAPRPRHIGGAVLGALLCDFGVMPDVTDPLEVDPADPVADDEAPAPGVGFLVEGLTRSPHRAVVEGSRLAGILGGSCRTVRYPRPAGEKQIGGASQEDRLCR